MRQLPEGKYYLRERLDSEGKGEIYIRYYVNGKRIKKAIGFKCHKENWDKEEERIKGNTPEVLQQNNFLRQFKNKVNLGIASYNGELSPLVVRNILNQQPADRNTTAQKTNLIEYVRKYNRMLYDTGACTYKTFINKESCINVFERFLRIEMNMLSISLNDISLAIIDKFIVYRSKTLENTSNEGINKSLVPIYKALDYACDNGLIERHVTGPITKHFLPCKKTVHIDMDDRKMRYLNDEQMRQLLEAYDNCHRMRTKEILDMYFFSYAACGLRFSDVMTLKWEHIDFKTKQLEKNIYKTRNRLVIPLNPMAVTILRKWRKKHNKGEYVFAFLDDDITDEEQLERRKNASNRTVNISLQSVGEKIKLPFSLTFHTARHTFAVKAINNGVDIKMLSKLMGHSTTLATEKVYAEVLNKTLRKAVNKMTELYQEIDTSRFENIKYE